MNIKKMMKQAQEMQRRIEEEVAAMTQEGSAGGGMVTAVMRGNKELVEIRVARDVVNPDDLEMLQDLIVAAVNEAGRKVDQALQDKLGGLGPGLGFPGA